MNTHVPVLPKHGGRLNDAIKKYANKNGCPDKEYWLDLSTGINPNGWPVPVLPGSIYNRLPENDDGLIEVALAYYQAKNILPVSGSQEAIQLLPVIFEQYNLFQRQLLQSQSFQKKLSRNDRCSKKATVGIVSPCYAEHEFQWKKNHFSVCHLTTENVDDVLDELDVLVLINPNNPTGEFIETEIIKRWQIRLNHKKRETQGYLIIDEAFMDSTPDSGMPDISTMDNLIVLRSVGKFFGLAGVRCGFVIAHPRILSLLKYHQGPWSVSGPTRWIVKKALCDKSWIEKNKLYLRKSSMRLKTLLEKYLINDQQYDMISGTVLFITIYINNASMIFEQLAQQGILVRLLDKSCQCHSCLLQYKSIKAQHKGLRFGLPANENQWQCLETVLKNITAYKEESTTKDRISTE
ncbi:MAG: aminotransferase class I/II-fold pyridoxal phosphate-dependent enzyme [Gammaproteobacteria bacterium]|nr:aminotransferase class I/II-fold pyridoxal phosphate-dependent enzyme [Gammaproteobacteria bacterium]